MRLRSGQLATCTWLALLGGVRADSLSVNFTNGTVNTTPAIVTYKTKGSDMGGMAFTFTFTSGPPTTSIWAPTGPNTGENLQLSTSGVRVELTGDTFFQKWTITNNNPNGLGLLRME